ncbi:MAG: hypothetical protein JWM91_1015 [Rhodospirillales bacterium]|nr:hypothetical protein [Rhodospirillales bacterium]
MSSAEEEWSSDMKTVEYYRALAGQALTRSRAIPPNPASALLECVARDLIEIAADLEGGTLGQSTAMPSREPTYQPQSNRSSN